MSGQTQPVKLTYEDYALIPEDGKRHEIIDGEHYVTPAPNTRHHAVVDPDLETVKIYRLTASGYAAAAELSRQPNARLTTPFLPGLDLPLSEVFS